jgi:hypothetical protein
MIRHKRLVETHLENTRGKTSHPVMLNAKTVPGARIYGACQLKILNQT